MTAIITEDLIYEILSVVEEIPEGNVASYGLAPHFHSQKELLLRENVAFKDDLHVDMKKCQWDC